MSVNSLSSGIEIPNILTSFNILDVLNKTYEQVTEEIEEKRKAARKRYCEKNKVELKQKQQEYCEKNKEKINAATTKRT
jgi:hypothetical protein